MPPPPAEFPASPDSPAMPPTAAGACASPLPPAVSPTQVPDGGGEGHGAEGRPVPTDPTEMRAGLGGEEVRRRLARAARHEETGRRVLAFYLVEMDARRLYQATGHGSTAFYAEARLDLDRRRTAELIRVGKKLLELREVDRAFCEGRLCWAKVLVVARMATPEHEAAWLARALALDVRHLTLLAARSKEGGPPRAAGDEKGLPEIRFPVSASVSPVVFAKLEQAQRRLGAELGRPVDVAGLLDALLDQFLSTEADGSVPGRQRVKASAFRVQLYESGKRGDPLLVETEHGPMPVDGGGAGLEGAMSEAIRCDAGVRNHYATGGSCRGHGGDHGQGQGASPGSAGAGKQAGNDTPTQAPPAHDHRAIDVKTPDSMRGAVLHRDGYRCRACRSYQKLMVHHVEFRSHGGRTLVQNLLTACSRCHALIHAGLLKIEGASERVARFVDAAGRAVNEALQIAEVELARLTPPESVEASGAAPGGATDAATGAATGAPRGASTS